MFTNGWPPQKNGAVSLTRVLGGGQNSSADCGRKLHNRKEPRWIEVILAGFIDHPQLTMLLRVSIRNDLIELPALEGCFISPITQTQNQIS